MTGIGAWIRYGGPLADGEIERAASRYRTAVLQPWETEAAARLKELVPSMTVLAYTCLSSVRPFEPGERRASGVSHARAEAEGWIARRPDGAPVEWSTYPGHLQARVWDPAYRAAWTEEVLLRTAGSDFDGVMADNDVFDDYYGLDLPAIARADPSAPADAAGLREHLTALVEEAGAALAGADRILVPNIAEARREPGRWERHAASGGGFEECWLGWGDDARLDEAACLAQMDELAGPGLTILRAPSGGRGPAFDASARARGAVARAWIWGGGSPSVSLAVTGHDDYSRTPWLPELGAELGSPLGPARRRGRVWRRDFEGGIAVVRAGGRRAPVSLPGGLVRPGPGGEPDGERLPRVVRLGPGEGLIGLSR